MPGNPHRSVRQKVDAIFKKLAGKRARSLEGPICARDVQRVVKKALSGRNATKKKTLQSEEIAFHMSDWNSDAAFIVALHLYPERFTPAEIEAGMGLYLCHAPHHILAAARLGGFETKDIFKKMKWG